MVVEVIDKEKGEVLQYDIKKPQMRSYNTAMQVPPSGEKNKELSLFVPGQSMELGEIISRSARGMEIPIVTKQGVYLSKSIDDEIDVLDKFDRDLTDYTRAMLKFRHQQEEFHRKQKEEKAKKDELYNKWLKELEIKKDLTPPPAE